MDVKYFNGDRELRNIQAFPNAAFSAMGGVRSKHNWYDSFKRLVGVSDDGALVPVTRKIEYKSNPSLHKCDARCQHAKGHSCECSCGGKYHGIGG